MLMRTLDPDMPLEPLTSAYAPLSAPGIAAGLRAAAPAQRPLDARLLDDPVATRTIGDQRKPSVVALEAVQTASRAYEQLRATGRELRFAATDTGLRIEVYDGTGALVRRIPPTEALALAAAEEATWLA